MSRFWRVFVTWFVVLMLFWVGANLAGMVRSMGLKPFRYTGFPFTVAVWGVGVAQYFDWWMLAGNTVIALGSSALLAWLCATVRCRVGITQCPQDRRPSEH